MQPDQFQTDSTIHLKNKRDEFLVEIRKKKNQEIIRQKRAKIFCQDDFQNNESMKNEDMALAHGTGLEKPKLIGLDQLPEDIKTKLFEAQKAFFDSIEYQDWETLLFIIRNLREAVGEEENKVSGRCIIELGLIPPLIKILGEPFIKMRALQVEAAWLIANVSASSTEETNYLLEHGIIDILLQCLKTTNDDLHENVIVMWTLANISGEEDLKYRDIIIGAGILKQIVRQLCTTPKKVMYSRTAVWLISNLLRGKPYPPYDSISCTLVALSQYIDNTDVLTQEHTLTALSYLSDSDDKSKWSTISGFGLVPKIVKCLKNSDNLQVIQAALRCTGNLATGSLKITRQLSENDIFTILPPLLNHTNKGLQREALYTLCNILADEFDDHDYVVDNNIVPILIEKITNAENDIKREATYCIRNFAHNCSIDECKTLVEKDVLQPLIHNLQSEDARLVAASIEALESILKHGEKLKDKFKIPNPFVTKIVEIKYQNYIENLLHHPIPEISTRVDSLITVYFLHNHGMMG